MLSRAVRRGHRGLRAILALVVIAAASAAGLLVTSAQASQPRATTALKQVSGTLPGIGLATLLNPASAGQTLEIGVGISRPDTAGEETLFNQIYDSSSPLYHHFLTPQEFNAQFGVKPATTAAVRNFLTSGGLSIVSSSTGGDYFLASGTVAQLDSLFHIQLGDYTYKGDRFLANNTAPSVPANLPIDAIAGLENLTHFSLEHTKSKQLASTHTAAQAVATSRRLLTGRTRTTTAAAHTSATVHPNLGLPVTVSDEGTEQTYTAQDLWGFYNAPGETLANSTGFSDPTTLENSKLTLGQGQIMGVFTEGEDSSVIRNLRLYESTLGLPKVPVRIVETEGTPDSSYSDNSGAEEWYLDSQSSTAMAPDVKQLDLFTAKTFQDADVAKEFNYWANDATGPREMNASFGECEENPTEPITGPLSDLPAGVALGGEMENLADPSLRQAAMEGRTLFASAGDTGSGCPTIVAPVLGGGNGLAIQPVPFQEYPCISDYVVCVGGTTPSSKGAGYPLATQRSNEQAWTYSGGGSSYFNPAPAYQDGITNLNTDCVSNDLGTTVYAPGQAPLCRGVPDVADMSGGGNDWFFFYNDGQPGIEGGTSLASPLMMGQWALTQAAASAATQSAGGLGFADPTIYKQAAPADKCTAAPCAQGTTYARDFNDITQAEDVGDVPGGQTGVAVPTGVGVANGVYAPGPGWDYVTGWGSLDDINFISDVTGSINATDADTGAEQAASNVCTASMTSPAANATDPVSDTNDPGLDVTAATLSTSGSNVVATMTVPELSKGLPATSALGAKFMVGWEYNGEFYFVNAEESLGGSFTYNAGNTGAPFAKGLPANNEYSDTNTVTGTVDQSTGLITITAPLSDVGTPPSGAALLDPQSFVVLELATLNITVDSADTLQNWSTDDGQRDSIGVNVIVDGTSANCSNTLPTTTVATSETGVLSSGSTPGTGGTKPKPKPTTKVKAPVTHITRKAMSTSVLKLSGYATAYYGHKITSVGVAIARTIQKTVKKKHVVECAFLTAKGTWTKAGSCAPRDYLKATGTSKWTFTLKHKFAPGIYYIWEHAEDNHKLITKNVASLHVFFRIK